MYYVIIWQAVDGHKMTEIFTSAKKRNQYLIDGAFNCYGGTACDIETVKPCDLEQLVKQSSAQFH